MEEEEKEKEGNGFIVKDKRHFFQQEGERVSDEEEKGGEPGTGEARLSREEGKGEAERKEEGEKK